MRSAALIPLVSLFLSSVSATINNQAEASSLEASSTIFPNGAYYLKNVKTGRTITYTRDSAGNNIEPLSGTGSLMNFQAHNQGTKWIRIQTPTSNKCISAQWDPDYDDGANWAGALYACQVDPIPAGSTLRPAKQFWLFQESQTVDNAYYIIPMDHLYDMATRGLQSCTRQTWGYRSICLDELDYTNQNFMWYVIPQGGSAPTTKATVAPSPTAAPANTNNAGTVVAAPTNNARTVTVTATRTVTKSVTQTAGCSRNRNPKIKLAMNNGAPMNDVQLGGLGGWWRRMRFGRE